jgi:hypothetical protein
MQPDGNLVLYDSKNLPTWASGTYGKGIGPYKLVVLDSGSFTVSDSGDAILWASNTAVPDIAVKEATIIAKLPVEPTPSPIVSKLDQFVKYEKLDRGGDDIGCFQEGNGADFCAEKCVGDASCAGFNAIPTGTTVWGGKGGCCYKRSTTPMGVSDYITFYVRKGSEKCYSTTFEASCSNTLETADYKLFMQPDGNLVLYKKSDNRPVWSSGTYGKGVGPYRMTMQPDGNLVVYDSKNAAIWESGTYGKGVGPYKVTLLNQGYFTVSDRSGAILWSSLNNAYYSICNKHGRCLAVRENSSNNGTGVIQWGKNDENGQKWKFDDGYLCNKNNKCLSAPSNSSNWGSGLIQWDKNNEDGQKWEFKGGAICNKHDVCLSARDNFSHDGVELIQWPMKDEAGQLWRLA